MKKIEAIIRPAKLDIVRGALETIGLPGLMISEIEGHGNQQGVTQQWRGTEFKVGLLPKVKIVVVVKDEDVDKVTTTIIRVAKTGEIGDGKIFISPIENAIRIRTGQSGNEALCP